MSRTNETRPSLQPYLYYPFVATVDEMNDVDTVTPVTIFKGEEVYWVLHKDTTIIESFTNSKHLACMRRFFVNGEKKVGRFDLGLYADTGKLKVYFLDKEFFDFDTNTWTNPKTNAVHIVDISATAKAQVSGQLYTRDVDFGILDNFSKNASGSIVSAHVEKAWQSINVCFGIRVKWTRGPLEITWYLDVPDKWVSFDIKYEVFNEDYFQQPDRSVKGDPLRDIFDIDTEGVVKTEDTSGPNRIVIYSMDDAPKRCDAADSRDWVDRFVDDAGLKVS